MSQWWCDVSTVWGLALQSALWSREEGEAVTAGSITILLQYYCTAILKAFFPTILGD